MSSHLESTPNEVQFELIWGAQEQEWALQAESTAERGAQQPEKGEWVEVARILGCREQGVRQGRTWATEPGGGQPARAPAVASGRRPVNCGKQLKFLSKGMHEG